MRSAPFRGKEARAQDRIAQGPLRPGGRGGGAKTRKFLGESRLRNAFWSTGNMRGGALNLSKLVEVGTWELARHTRSGVGLSRRQGKPACKSVGVEERNFCGPGVWPEMEIFAVACWCGFFSGGVADRECRVTAQENPEGHQGKPACTSVGVEERNFCGSGVWPEMEIFAVACWCSFFSGGVVDRECRVTAQENPEGHLSGRRQGKPACASVGVEERNFCGSGVWPEMKIFAVACWCSFFSSGVVDREPRLNANGVGRRLVIVERGGAISESVKKYIKNVCDASYSPKKHGHEEFCPQWRTVETVDDAAGSPSLPPTSSSSSSSSISFFIVRIMIQDGQMSAVSAEGRMFA